MIPYLMKFRAIPKDKSSGESNLGVFAAQIPVSQVETDAFVQAVKCARAELPRQIQVIIAAGPTPVRIQLKVITAKPAGYIRRKRSGILEVKIAVDQKSGAFPLSLQGGYLAKIAEILRAGVKDRFVQFVGLEHRFGLQTELFGYIVAESHAGKITRVRPVLDRKAGAAEKIVAEPPAIGEGFGECRAGVNLDISFFPGSDGGA